MPDSARARTRCERPLVVVAALASLFVADSRAQQLIVDVRVSGPNRNESEVDIASSAACAAIEQIDGASAEQSDLLGTCEALAGLGDTDPIRLVGLGRLVPEEAFIVSDTLTDAADPQLVDSYARVRTLRFQRAAPDTVDAGDARLAPPRWRAASGGGAADDESFTSRLQVFAAGHVSSGDYDGAQLQQDTEIDATNVGVGLDYRLASAVVVGATVALLRNESAIRGDVGGASADGVNLTLFGTWSSPAALYADAALSLHRSGHELERRIDIVGSDPQIASAETDATTLSVSGSIGRDFAIGGWNLGPYARAKATSASIDAYDETADASSSGFGATLHVDAQSAQSTILSLGSHLSRAFGVPSGVIVPQLGIELVFETQSEKDPLSAYFLADPNQTLFSVDGEERDATFANVGLGATGVFGGGKSGFVYLETRLLHDRLSQVWLKGGFRWEL